LAEETNGIGQESQEESNLFVADSWFASVKLAEALDEKRHAFIGPIKTNHGG
jgi:hypothetical protein